MSTNTDKKNQLLNFGKVHDEIKILTTNLLKDENKATINRPNQIIAGMISNRRGAISEREPEANFLDINWEKLKTAGITGGDILELFPFIKELEESRLAWQNIGLDKKREREILASIDKVRREYFDLRAEMVKIFENVLRNAPTKKESFLEYDRQGFSELLEDLETNKNIIWDKKNTVSADSPSSAVGDIITGIDLRSAERESGILTTSATKLRRSKLDAEIKLFNKTVKDYLKTVKDLKFLKQKVVPELRKAGLKSKNSILKIWDTEIKKQDDDYKNEYIDYVKPLGLTKTQLKELMTYVNLSYYREPIWHIIKFDTNTR